MREAVVDGDVALAADLARRALESGIAPEEAIERGFGAGITRVGELWEEGEFFLPELMMGAEAMKAAMAELLPAIQARQGGGARRRRIAIGTVEGDVHDIGKSLVATLLASDGFDVLDLGADVPVERFVEAAADGCELIALSALLTTTVRSQKAVIERLVSEGLRSTVKVIVGGAAVTPRWAETIGADAYGQDAPAAVRLARDLLGA